MGIDEVLSTLGTSRDGLDPEEASRRLEKYGLNELVEHRVSPLRVLARQFTSLFIVVLLAAALIAVFLGEGLEGVAIIAVVGIMVFAGFVQEYRAEKTIEALKKLSKPVARVVRGGRLVEVPSPEIVPGDIVVLREGSFIPADLRLVETMDLEVDESPLTGESVLVQKDASRVLPVDTPLADRVNMAFMGTYVVGGKGVGVVVATGMNTVIGRIAEEISRTPEEKTRLEEELDDFARKITLLVILIVGAVFALSVLVYREGLIDSFLLALALAVAAVPEGLPVVATSVMGIGAYRMARKNALVKRLSAIEALGSIDVICTDKTGTLTRGEMTVKRIVFYGGEYYVEGTGYEPRGGFRTSGEENRDDLEMLAILSAIHTLGDNMLVEEEGRWVVKGSPTEGAVLVLAYKYLGREGVERVASEFPLVRTIPFDRRRKMKTTIHRYHGGFLQVTSGAPEIVLSRSARVRVRGSEKPITEGVREELVSAIESLAREGYRTLGIAYRTHNGEPGENVEEDLVFLAVLGIIDPPREGVSEAVEAARRAGIRVVIITGDHRLTALAVARSIGIDADEDRVIDGARLDQLSDDELQDIVDRVNVYARVSPEHKARIVCALKKRGYRVAMTGDGINDAPALKLADIGIAMGVRGTDVAKEAADLVLLDDDFSTIIEAVREGRIIYENLKKPIYYLLRGNLGEIMIVAAAEFLGLPPPLRPIHILWVNIATDSFPALALSLEPPEPGIMDRPPRPPEEKILDRRKFTRITFIAVVLAASILGLYTLALQPFGARGDNLLEAQTIAFTALAISEILIALTMRSEKISFWRLPPNKWLLATIPAIILLQLALIYTPLSIFFKTTPLKPGKWLLLMPFTTIPLIIDEARKRIRDKTI